MTSGQPRFLHPIDHQKALAGQAMGRGSAEVPTHTYPSGFVGQVRTICSKCKEPITDLSKMINFVSVCDFCYETHRISHNPVERCPYKQPHSRKLPKKPEPIKFVLSNTNTTVFGQHDYVITGGHVVKYERKKNEPLS